MLPTGGGVVAVVTVRLAVPLLPSLEAVTIATPAASAVTTPVPDIVATLRLLELQTMGRPVRTLLLESRVVALACVVPPTVIELAARATLTEATDCWDAGVESVTVRFALPLFVPRVAVMATTPADFAVTRPESETVATAELPELQTTMRVSRRPARSRRIAVARVVSPASSELRASVTVVVATRDSSTAESSSEMPDTSDAGPSEQESTVKKALAIAIAPSCLRFMISPMNRATSFDRSRPYVLHMLTPVGIYITMLDFQAKGDETINAPKCDAHVFGEGFFRR